MSTLLKTQGVCRDFNIGDGSVVHALKDINIEIESGKLTVLRGRSGSGKTTLINLLGALDKPTAGTINFGDTEITSISEARRDKLRRFDMAFVFQSVALISSMTALENVEFALRLANIPYDERQKRAKKCLALVGLEKRMTHRPAEMSGGEQQRVAIARAIAHEPQLIFADEPTAELDTATGLAVVKLFKDLVEQHKLTIIMTTHDPSMMEVADKVYTLEDGEIIA
ncbi:MAG TPA: ABC transporter ATP-binding protein [Oscillospiraceae bacterium]|nr:ABC transporter ATP-binding protein [Oscillospiraceae bacterium]